jgi:Flp pilus assembly protein TadB
MLQNVPPVDLAEAVIAIAECRCGAIPSRRQVRAAEHVSKKSSEQSMAAAKDELAKERAAFEPSMAALQKARTELDAGMIWPCTPSPARLRSV